MVASLKYKKGIAVTNVFQKVLCKSGSKLSKLWVIKTTNFTINH